jgi:hypothetical protein
MNGRDLFDFKAFLKILNFKIYLQKVNIIKFIFLKALIINHNQFLKIVSYNKNFHSFKFNNDQIKSESLSVSSSSDRKSPSFWTSCLK